MKKDNTFLQILRLIGEAHDKIIEAQDLAESEDDEYRIDSGLDDALDNLETELSEWDFAGEDDPEGAFKETFGVDDGCYELDQNELNEEMETRKNVVDPVFDYRVVLDMCTPTAERRTTTEDDIRDDIRVIEGRGTLKDFMHATGLSDELVDEDEYKEALSDGTIEDTVVNLIGDYRGDPGDGTPNVFYLSINGEEVINEPYYDIDSELLAHGSPEEIVTNILENNPDIYEDGDEDAGWY